MLLLVTAVAAVGCAHGDPRVFKLREPVVRDQDLDPVAVDCKQTPKGPSCTPDVYESSFSWDAADNLIFRPISKLFAAEAVGEAKNVNAFDEVPDSSWFVNRIGARPMSPEEAAGGYCPYDKVLTSNPADGAWLIDYGKDNGANPGFRVNVDGTKFMFKTDDEQIERATAATAIASRLYFAAGWWAPCDAVVYFKKSALVLKPGLMIKQNTGLPFPFDSARLDKVLEKTGRRGDAFRATASRFVPGKALGPFTYEGLRADDPNDVIPHEDRRDLRGARIIAAWTNHFDSREQNSMSTWLPLDPKNPQSPGHVRHWYIDLGDCFGSEWTVDGLSRRHGYSYVLDVEHILEDWATLGIRERPWDRATRTPGAEIFGYYRSSDFDPEVWRGEYPNPAFGRATEHDNAWGARLIARFTPDHIVRAVEVGDFTNPEHTRFLARMLIERRMKILARYFARLSPLTDPSIEADELCAIDLARATETYPATSFRYSARVRRGSGQRVAVAVRALPAGKVCLPLAARAPDGGLPDDAAERYLVAEVDNGSSRAPVRVHAYDLGPRRGLALVGLERPNP